MKQGQFPAVLLLASLNGQNGFKIDGEGANDRLGILSNRIGDVNGDGISDLFIGSPYYNSFTGRSYVIFGSPTVGSSGTFSLSILNGANGFKLDGENTGDYSAYSISLGDINGDGKTDLLIGAHGYNSFTGRSYVVFAGTGVGSSGLISLSALNGVNGFTLDGEVASDRSGYSLTSPGDVNNDQIADLLVGAYLHNTGGRSYIVFGKSGIGGSGSLPLSSLNGVNGFVLNGEIVGDYSGFIVSAAGDLNNDTIADFSIGAYNHNSSVGRSYVIFGKAGIGGSGSLPLSSLSGANGFKLNGEVAGDDSGWVVSAPGDVNQDGCADLFLSAFAHSNNAGRSYTVFGSSTVGNTGLVGLSGLNGMNGYRIDGELNSFSGYSVSEAGDINGDGIKDLLIGAYNYHNETGRSYVIFGGQRVGVTGLLNVSSLNGMNGFKLDGEVPIEDSGVFVAAAGDINHDGVDDLLIGADHHNSWTGRIYVVFGDAPPVLVNNSLSLSPGATITVNATYLAATDRNHNNNTLVFIPSNVSHGYFEVITNPGVSLVNFTQQQVVSGTIQFVHDGTLVAPSYNITVRSTGIAWVGPVSAKINFIGAPQSHFPAIIPLSSLNGQNGFKMDGEVMGDKSGWSVSPAGDVNVDGYADLLIGAFNHNSNTGRSYVVFGGPGVGSGGLLNLTNLNGVNGFKLDGEAPGAFSGISVSAAGDINSDGAEDLIIGSSGYASSVGRSYVLFGKSGIGKNGLFALASLNGTNGFKLNGEKSGDGSGTSIRGAGDINGDGHPDLLIGAYGHSSGIGRSYVVFGGLGVGGSGLLNLTSLNGMNGFKLDGETTGDFSGIWVSSAGDVNGDGYSDLLIGAYGHQNYTGRSYVVFGGSGVGSGGVLSLSNLNGANGFKIEGETVGDYSGISVSLGGDINADGNDDLLIGAYRYKKMTGCSYVVFGGAKVGNQGLLNLANLDGMNGFRVVGEAVNDLSGYPVSSGGDVNGDGQVDLLIAAYGHNSSIGRSYVVFGGPDIGTLGFVNLTLLNGVSGFKLDGEIVNDYSGYSINAAGDINGDGVQDLLIGAQGHHNRTGRTYVVFGDIPPVLVQNRLILQSGSKIPLNSTFLSAYDHNHNNNTMVFVPTALTHGHFELVSQPGIALVNFTQPQLQSGSIRFVHDGSSIAPSYNITVYSAGIAWTGPSSANITFILTPTTTFQTSTLVQTPTPSATSTSAPTKTPTSMPTATPFSLMLLNNQLTLSNGQTVILSANNLKASEAGVNNSQLIFSVGNVQNGYFSTVPNTGVTKNLTSFTQSQIQSGDIEFVHAGNNQAPGYSVIVSDGVQSTLPGAAAIDFTGAPIITQNAVNLTTGSTITLTPAMLNLTITDGSMPSQVILTVSNLQHGVITSTLTGTPVNNFTLAVLQAGDIHLTQDGSLITPSYTITAYVPKTSLSSAPDPATVLFSNQGVFAPQLVNNYLVVTQGKSTTLSNRYLSAMEPQGGILGNNTIFYVNSVTHGHFSLIAQPQLWISFFNQGQLSNGEVQFTHDGSSSIPGYDSSVQAFGLQSASLPAGIFFSPVNQPPQLVQPLTDQTAVVGQPFSYDISSSFTDPNGDAITFLVSRFNSDVTLPSWLNFNELNDRFTGIPTATDFLDINVTAQDTQGLATTTDVTLTVSAAPVNTGYSTVQKAIIGAVVSGTIGIFFAVLQGCLKRAANKKLLQALGEDSDEYDQKVVRPVAKEIAQRVKITGFMNYTTNTRMVHFKGAVRKILSELNARKVNLDFKAMSPVDRDSLINEIASQTRKILLPNQGCCRCTGLTSFFKAQTTPEEIEKAAPAIAAAVVQSLSITVRSASSGAPSMELPELSGSKNILLRAPSSSQVPPASPSGVEPPRQEGGSSQILGL